VKTLICTWSHVTKVKGTDVRADTSRMVTLDIVIHDRYGLRMLSTTLEKRRLEHGFSRATLSRKANVSEPTIYRMERDPDYEPGVFTTKRLADALGVGVDDLIHEVDGSAPPTGRGKNTGTRSAAGKRSPGPDSHEGE
jgi:transcriptional regulator with XRE-family HTH domain